MKHSAQPDLLGAIVEMSAMVFAAIAPDHALQSLADALGVQTVAIGRVDKATNGATTLAQNLAGSLGAANWSDQTYSPTRYSVVLGETENHQDLLILQTRLHGITQDQRDTLDIHVPYLVTLWASHSNSFERVASIGRTPAVQNVLHPDNPYSLTATEIRICSLIAAGQNPTMMAHTMNAAMPTIRTHLRNIYVKTGVDGMTGIIRNLLINSDDEKIAS